VSSYLRKNTVRAVFVTPHFGPVLGGIQKDMLLLAREFSAQGDPVAFVTTYDEFPEGPVSLSQPPTYDLPPAIPVVRLKGHWRSRLRDFHPANASLWVPGLTRTVWQFRPDTVIFFNIGWPLTVLPALLALRRQTVVLYRTAYHAYQDRRPLNPLRQRLLLGVAGLSHRLVSYSHFEKQQIMEQGHVPAEKIVPIYPGVEAIPPSAEELAAFRAAHGLENRVVISHVARLGAFKGTDSLIRVLPQVRAQTGQDVVLLLVGRNVQEDYLDGLVRERGVANHVRFTGPVEERDLHLAYAASDVFALPSQYESLGFVFLEALAHGVPVIGVNTGGVAEVIHHGENGYLLSDAGQVGQLQEHLVRLVTNRGLREQMGQQGQRRVQAEFSWPRCAAQFKEIIASIRAG
jgi:glycosyltransferase involved in cell wall biosynthesis